METAAPAPTLDPDAWAEVIAALPDGIVVQDADGRIVGANPQACELLGLTMGQLLGRDSFDPRWRAVRVDGSDFPGDEHPAVVTLRTGVPFDDVVMGVDAPATASRRWISITSRLLPPGRVVTCFRDVTAHHVEHVDLTERELHYRILTETSSDLVVHIDDDGIVRYQSPASIDLIGSAVGTPLSDELARAVHPDDQPLVAEQMARIAAGDSSVPTREIRLRCRDGEWRWFDRRVWRAQGIPGVIVESHDVTALKEVERKLADTEEFFRQAFEEAPIGLSLAAIDHLGDPVIVRANRLYAHAYGFEPDELMGRSISNQIHPDDWPAAQAARQRLLSGQSARERMQVRIIRRDGSVLWCTMTRSVLRDRAGAPRFTMAQLEDATETRAMVSQLAALAHSDPLTGLPNRRGLEIELAALLADPVAAAHAAVFFLDLDGFKVVNDRLGHREGDAALREVAQRLVGLTRTHDTVARVGGDEFVILARHVGSEAAAEAMRDRLSNLQVEVGQPPATLRASVGLACPHAHDSVQAVLDRADRVMYRYKRHARTTSTTG